MLASTTVPPGGGRRRIYRFAGTLQRKVADWAIVTALVLGSAYRATRPGSDIPDAEGKASARKYAPIERFVEDEMKVRRIPGA